MEKETQLHVAQKKLLKWVEVEKSCQLTRVKFLRELDMAKKTADMLAGKLQAINESKESSIIIMSPSETPTQSTCSAVIDDDSWNQEMENTREQLAAAVSEVDSTKQELRRIKIQLSVSVDAKQASLRQEEDARKSSHVNSERSEQLRKEIAAVEESIAHMRSKDFHSKVEETSIVSEHEAVLKSHRLALEDVENDVKSMVKGLDPETIVGLQRKVEETEAEIEHLQMEMEETRVSDLDNAKKGLERVEEEQTRLNCFIVTLRNQLEDSKIQHLELKKSQDQTQSVYEKLELDVHDFKVVFEKARSSEAINREEYEQKVSNLEKLVSESGNRKKLADELKKSTTNVKMESDRTQDAIDEAEKKVEEAARMAEEAKTAEAEALNQIKILNEASPPQPPSSEPATTKGGGGGGAMITITAEKYESLRKSMEDFGTSADEKVAEATVEREAIVESENKAIQQLEESSQEMEQLKLETKEIMKMAETCEEALKAVEEEARKEMAAAEEEEEEEVVGEEEDDEEDEDESLAIVPVTTNQPPQQSSEKRAKGNRKWTQKTPDIRKKLMPNLGGIFHRKKNVAGSKCPSNHPDRKSVS